MAPNKHDAEYRSGIRYRCFMCRFSFGMLEEFRAHNRNTHPELDSPAGSRPGSLSQHARHPSVRATEIAQRTEDLASNSALLESQPETSTKTPTPHTLSHRPRHAPRMAPRMANSSGRGTTKFIHCSYRGCQMTNVSQAEVDKHYRMTHGPKHLICPMPTCGKTFALEYLVTEHLRCDHRCSQEQLCNMGVGWIPNPVDRGLPAPTKNISTPSVSAKQDPSVRSNTAARAPNEQASVIQPVHSSGPAAGPTSTNVHPMGAQQRIEPQFFLDYDPRTLRINHMGSVGVEQQQSTQLQHAGNIPINSTTVSGPGFLGSANMSMANPQISHSGNMHVNPFQQYQQVTPAFHSFHHQNQQQQNQSWCNQQHQYQLQQQQFQQQQLRQNQYQQHQQYQANISPPPHFPQAFRPPGQHAHAPNPGHGGMQMTPAMRAQYETHQTAWAAFRGRQQ